MGAIPVFGDIVREGVSAFAGGGGGPTNLVFLSTGQQLPDPLTANTLYIDRDNNLLYYLNSDNQTFCVPLEGFLLADIEATSDLGVTTTTSTTFQTKVSHTVASVSGPVIAMFPYGWNLDSTGADIEVQILQNGTQIGQLHKQEPQDSSGTFGSTGTDQRFNSIKVLPLTVVPGDVFDVQFRTSVGGTEASLWDASVILFQI